MPLHHLLLLALALPCTLAVSGPALALASLALPCTLAVSGLHPDPIQCYRDPTAGEVAACPTSAEAVESAQGWLAGAWKKSKDWLQGAAKTVGITDQDFIDDFGETLKTELGIDLTSHQKNSQWVQKAMNIFWLDFDLSANCLVAFKKDSGETTSRACGGAGELGKISSSLLSYLQGNAFSPLAGMACFTMPGDKTQEVCICKTDGCNKDSRTAKESQGVSAEARSVECGGRDCPVMDISKMIADWTGFNTACYTKSDGVERCFSTEGLLDEQVVEAAKQVTHSPRAARQTSGQYTFTKMSGAGARESSSFLLPVLLLLACHLLGHP